MRSSTLRVERGLPMPSATIIVSEDEPLEATRSCDCRRRMAYYTTADVMTQE